MYVTMEDSKNMKINKEKTNTLYGIFRKLWAFTVACVFHKLISHAKE